jgi:AcrR family transcriptional regulator
MRKIKTKPAFLRRAPVQKRSQQLILDIVEGGFIVLEKNGWKGFSTNRIAQATGVSIGSLYQYFNNKEEILMVMNEHVGEDLLNNAIGKLHKSENSSLADFAETLVKSLFTVLLEKQSRFRLLFMPTEKNLTKSVLRKSQEVFFDHLIEFINEEFPITGVDNIKKRSNLIRVLMLSFLGVAENLLEEVRGKHKSRVYMTTFSNLTRHAFESY